MPFSIHSQWRLMLFASITLQLVACSPNTITKDTAVQKSRHLIQGSNISQTTPRRPIQANWWNAFGDSQLTMLIQQALQANPDIRSARLNLVSARAQSKIAAANLLPSLNASGKVLHDGSQPNFTASLDASWETEIFGNRQTPLQAANIGLQSAQASLEDVKASIAGEVARNYIDLRLAQQRLRTMQQNLQYLAQNANLIRLRNKAGEISGLEVDQAQLGVNQTRSQLPEQQENIAKVQRALAILTGQSADAVARRLGNNSKLPTVPYPIVKIPAEALRQRPDIRVAEYKVQEASLGLREAKANLRPSFRLGGTLSLNFNSLKLEDLFDTQRLVRSLFASITSPLLDAGRLKQKVVISDANYQQAVIGYQKALLVALQDIANNFGSLATLRQQKPLLINNLKLAISSERLAKMNFDVGRDNYLSVMAAQDKVRSAQESLLLVQANELKTLISLYKSVGGAW